MERIAKVINQLGYIVFTVCALSCISMLTGHGINATTTTTVEHAPIVITHPACAPADIGLFSPCADLDDSHIDDLRTEAQKTADPTLDDLHS